MAAGTGKLLAKPLANAAAQMAEGSVAKGATKLAANAAEAAAGAVAQEAGRQGVRQIHWFMRKPGEGSDLNDIAVMGAISGGRSRCRCVGQSRQGRWQRRDEGRPMGFRKKIQNYMKNYEASNFSRQRKKLRRH